MNGIHIEHHALEPKRANIDLINQIRARYTFGPAVIITDTPSTFLGTLRKQWIREMAFLAKARASTLDTVKIARLSQELLVMETLQFDARGSGDNSADVYILSPEQLDLIPTHCATIYLYSRLLNPEALELSNYDRDVLIVDYCHEPNGSEIKQKRRGFADSS